MADKKSFMMYLDTIAQWDMLTDAQAGQLVKALMAYANDGTLIDIDDGMVKMAFSFMSAQIDRDNEKYAEKCKQNSEKARIRWHKKDADACNGIPMDANDADKDKEKDKEKDTDTDKDKERDKDNLITLTPQEYKKLVLDYGETTVSEYVEKVENYCRSSGKRYKNYDATIRTWLSRDGLKKSDMEKYEFSINRFDAPS